MLPQLSTSLGLPNAGTLSWACPPLSLGLVQQVELLGLVQQVESLGLTQQVESLGLTQQLDELGRVHVGAVGRGAGLVTP